MFCGYHDVVGCSVCFALDHKSCDDIHYIPDYVQTNKPTAHINKIKIKLTKAIKTMTELKVRHDRFDGDLDKSKATCKHEIQKYRKEINLIIDKIEAATLAEIDSSHIDTKKKTGDKKKNIQDLQDEMERFKSEIRSNQSNDSQKFVILKLSQCILKKGDDFQSELSKEKNSELTFTRNDGIMSFLMGIVTLGILSPTITQYFSLPTSTAGSKQLKQTKPAVIPSTPGESNTPKKQLDAAVVMTTRNSDLYKIIDRSQYTIKQPDDKTKNDIWSSCISDNNDVLLVGYGNNKLKVVDGRSYAIRSTLAFDVQPRSVCRVSCTEVAVSMFNRTIHFVSTQDKFVQKHSLSMKHPCGCIAVHRDKLYVGDFVCLYIYSLKGKLVNTINTDKTGQKIFSFIRDIAVSDEEMIHVADKDNGVITLNTEGNVVWRYSDKKLSEARGLCTDGKGNVIVCGQMSNNVIQLGPDGQYIGEVISLGDCVKNPKTVRYDRNNKKLTIGSLDDKITVFTVQ